MEVSPRLTLYVQTIEGRWKVWDGDQKWSKHASDDVWVWVQPPRCYSRWQHQPTEITSTHGVETSQLARDEHEHERRPRLNSRSIEAHGVVTFQAGRQR